MKKFLLTLGIIFSISSVVYAGNVNVQLNGKNIDFTDSNGNKVEAQIVNSRTMVPMRKIFELLGADIEWDGSTSTVTANKNDTSIKLQINNENAEITKSGKTQTLKLDSKPILIEGRTMVPLRFISESLDKQVGWDAQNSTAIIIDYDYFTNKIKDKSALLYEFILNNPSTTEIQITRTYTDIKNSIYNNTSTVNVTAVKTSENSRDLIIDFVGDSELFKEIASEGWSNISLNLKFDKEGVVYITSNNVLAEMLGSTSCTYDLLDLSGSYDITLGDVIREIVNINSDSLNINTFSNLQKEFDNFLKLFTVSNNENVSTIKLQTLNYNNAHNKYFDYTKFDDIIFDNEFIKIYSIINRLLFNYDVRLDELLYDTSNISGSMTIQKDNLGFNLSAMAELLNEYNEKIKYSIIIKEK